MGNAVNNLEHWFHFQPATKLFEIRAHRHFGKDKINVYTPVVDIKTWAKIVSSARTDSDKGFYETLHSIWPEWAENMKNFEGENLVSGYRLAVLRIVDPHLYLFQKVDQD